MTAIDRIKELLPNITQSAWSLGGGGTIGSVETVDDRSVVAQTQQVGPDDRNNGHAERRANAEFIVLCRNNIAALIEDLQLKNDMLAALKHTIVFTIGGVDYKGNPTSDINYLQRLRILIEKEQELERLKEELKRR